jgi:hypothetical protein
VRNVWLALILILIPLATSGCLPPDGGEFAIFLLAEDLSLDQVAAVDLDKLELEDEPILSIDDVVAYSQETHEIEVTAAAYERINRLSVPVTGTPFVVCAGGEPIYAGAFWPLYSSLSFDGVVIQVPLVEEGRIPITLGYPGESFFQGQDPRGDDRIMRALERAEKLRSHRGRGQGSRIRS